MPDKKITIRITDELFKQFRIALITRNQTAQAVLEQAVKDYLTKSEEGTEMTNKNCYTSFSSSKFSEAVLFDPERWGEGADMGKIRDAVENRFYEQTGLQILPKTSECVGPVSAWDKIENEDLTEILDEITNNIWENEMENFLVDEA